MSATPAINDGSSSSSSPSFSSSSSTSPANGSGHQARVRDEADEPELLGEETRDRDFDRNGNDGGDNGDDDDDDEGILGDDPLDEDHNQPLSFKRKKKRSIFSQPARFLKTLAGARGDSSASPLGRSPPVNTRLDGLAPNGRFGGGGLGGRGEYITPGTTKDDLPLDWYVEGPGRRVGYEDLTAIDWIFEYTKERQRLRVLYSSATGLVGSLQRLLDASQVWVVLVLTGLAVGSVAAAIDVTTDWLGDMKFGYCTTENGGAFYLSKGFCCLGYDDHSKCVGWRPWAAALGIASVAGKWFIEYFFFLLWSVGAFNIFFFAPFLLFSLLPPPRLGRRQEEFSIFSLIYLFIYFLTFLTSY